jgi:hypothetical protein
MTVSRRNVSPTISDPLEQPNSRSRSVTAALASRLFLITASLPSAGWLRQTVGRAASRLANCAEWGRLRTGRRCGAAYCPRCAAPRAKKYKTRLSKRMHLRAAAGAAAHGFGFLTITVAANTPLDGYRDLMRAWQSLARRVVTKQAFRGGEGHIQAEPARGSGGERWNVHLHALVELARPLGQTRKERWPTAGTMSCIGWGCTVPSRSGGRSTSPRQRFASTAPAATVTPRRSTPLEGHSASGWQTNPPSWRRGSSSSPTGPAWSPPGGPGGKANVRSEHSQRRGQPLADRLTSTELPPGMRGRHTFVETAS